MNKKKVIFTKFSETHHYQILGKDRNVFRISKINLYLYLY